MSSVFKPYIASAAMPPAVAVQPTAQDDIVSFRADVFRLFSQQVSGNMAEYTYGAPHDAEDPAAGLDLFEQLCQDDQYYVRRAEIKLIADNLLEIARLIGPGASVFELGPGPVGAISAKMCPIIESLEGVKSYTGIDHCRAVSERAEQFMRQEFPQIPVRCITADFTKATNLAADQERPVFFCFGSTVGNFPRSAISPNPYIVEFMARMRSVVGENGLLVISQDCNQNKASLMRAYNNEASRKLMANLMARMKHDAKASIDLDKVEYYVEWNKDLYCVEMGIVMLEDQSIVYDNIYFDMRKGQKLHIWNSHKYSVRLFSKIANQAGFDIVKQFVDADQKAALHILKPRS